MSYVVILIRVSKPSILLTMLKPYIYIVYIVEQSNGQSGDTVSIPFREFRCFLNTKLEEQTLVTCKMNNIFPKKCTIKTEWGSALAGTLTANQ